MPVRDTTPDAAAIQAAIYRRMTTDQRTWAAAQMSAMARGIALENIRARHLSVEHRATAEDTIIAQLEWAKLVHPTASLRTSPASCECADLISTSTTSSAGSPSWSWWSRGRELALLSELDFFD